MGNLPELLREMRIVADSLSIKSPRPGCLDPAKLRRANELRKQVLEWSKSEGGQKPDGKPGSRGKYRLTEIGVELQAVLGHLGRVVYRARQSSFTPEQKDADIARAAEALKAAAGVLERWLEGRHEWSQPFASQAVLAKSLGVSVRTIRNWHGSGKARNEGRGRWFVRLDVLRDDQRARAQSGN